MTYRNRKLLDLAHEMPCQAKFPHACTGHLSVIPAHSNQLKHGRGSYHKADDCFFAAMCGEAHREIDSGMWSRDQKNAEWELAHAETMRWLWENEKVRVA